MIYIKNRYIPHLADGSVIFDGCEEAIVGLTHHDLPIYDYIKLIEVFMDQGMDEEEAMEWIEYNVVCVNGGEGFCIMYYY